MKKSFYIFFIIIIGAIGFFGLNFSDSVKAQANLPAQKTGDTIPLGEITVEQLNTEANNCKDNKLRATDDAAARKECPAQEPFYREIGKVDGKYYCCQPPGLLVVQTPLGPVAPGDQAKRNESLLTSTCGEGYDYPVEPQQTIPYEKIDKGLNIVWPASPMGTAFSGANGIPGLIKYIYDWLISLGGLMVFITLIWAGIQYLTSAGNPTQMSGAMKRIKTASIGLALLFGSWLILNTINPRLINLGINTENLKGNTALDLGLKRSPKGSGKPCGTTCDGVEFCTEPNFNSCGKIIKVGEGKTIQNNMSIKVKSVRFQPYQPTENPPNIGDCSVTLYQRPIKDRGFTDGKEPLILLSPVKDIGADGFPVESYDATDMSGSGGSYFNFQPK